MTRTRIKICGICSIDDAEMACAAGADAIGFVFYEKSPRYVTAESAAEIVASLPPFVSVVGLFVNHNQQEVRQVLSCVKLDLLQFHGNEDEPFCNSFDRPYIKVIRIKADTDLPGFCREYASARGVLLDSYQKGKPGGTGETFDWGLITNDLPHPVILAGGLNAGNVKDAVSIIQPWAVDVSSGVETSPGKKDLRKINDFIEVVNGIRITG